MKLPAGLALALALAGCVERAPPPIARGAAAAVVMAGAQGADAAHERGRAIWNFRCYFCHGYSGDARTLASTYLSPPPRDFTRESSRALTLPQMRAAIAQGKPGTAMKGFNGILDEADIAAVAGFVRREFIETGSANTRYHTAENGWPDHERHRAAFAFARGELALDTPSDQLDDEQRRGKRLFMSTCISCHDRGHVRDAGAAWETRALSYPRDAYCTSCHDQPNGDGLRQEQLRARPTIRRHRQPRRWRRPISCTTASRRCPTPTRWSAKARRCTSATARSAMPPTAPRRAGSVGSWNRTRAT